MEFQTILNSVQAGSFLASKPIREVREIDLKRNPEVIGSRKYNGNFSTAVTQGAGQFNFFTISNLPLASFLAGTSYSNPLWANDPAWRSGMASIPSQSIVLGEIFIPSVTMENLGAFQEWYTWHKNSLANTGAAMPAPAMYRVFDVLAWNGKSIAHLPYRERFQYIPEAVRVERAPFTSLQEANSAITRAQELSIEGFVLWDANAPSQCKLEGKNHARRGAWKAKPLYKEKFMLLGFTNPTSENMVATLGNATITFNCGSGLEPAERRELISLWKQAIAVNVEVAHYGYNEQGKPEIPIIAGFEKV